MYRIGIGIDIHPFATGRELWLGGVKLDYPLGLAGHSDADALVHAITDAILGALGKRDIGFYYPPEEVAWKGYPGCRFLQDMRGLLQREGFTIANLDSVVIAQQPRLSPYVPDMTRVIASHLDITPEQVGIKATTSEGMGFTGRGEGIAAQAVVLLEKKRKKK